VEYRNLGKDGPSVSAIGFGCWEMGGQHCGGTDDAEVTRAVHRAIDLGCSPVTPEMAGSSPVASARLSACLDPGR
jgi:predicted aldo/keto reductase-like oxidoreductase